ncbi:MAG TPA: hypothetical protein VF212_11190 [Longimicrobiales bacterium]
MRKDLVRSALALALAMAVVACDDDGPTDGQQDELTQAEAEALAAAMANQGYAGAEEGSQAGGEQAFAPQSHGAGEHFNFTLENVERPCPLGGTVVQNASGSITSYTEEERVVIDLEGTQTHEACGFAAEQTQFEVTGDPNLAWTVHLEAVDSQPVGEQTVALEGGFTWSSADGRSGTCTVDLSAVLNPEAQSWTLTGTFCGVTIESTASWTDA